MKVVVLGGGGGMGEVAAREVAAFDFVEAVTVADRNGERAHHVADQVGAKASATAIDIHDRAAMAQILQDHDLVLNSVGPFYTHGTTVLEQAIDAGRNYADICDDWEPTLSMLDLSERATQRGVTAVIGIGASPGVTNLLARIAAEQLDEVDELLTGWSIETNEDDPEAYPAELPEEIGTSAAVIHWVQQLTGTIRILKDGAYIDAKPLERRTIRYPGRKYFDLWLVGHPEAVTLARAVPGLKACSNVMVGPAETFEGLGVLATMVDQGQLTIQQAAELIVKDMVSRADAPPAPRTGAPGLFGWASGRKDGVDMIAAACVRSMPKGGMGGATSVPFAQILGFFHENPQPRRGVFAPEEILDPKRFFDGLAPKCIGNYASFEDLVEVSACLA